MTLGGFENRSRVDAVGWGEKLCTLLYIDLKLGNRELSPHSLVFSEREQTPTYRYQTYQDT